MSRDNEGEVFYLGRDERFPFYCGKTVSCFTECCRDLNQPLTPYDAMRLKNALNLDSESFLKEYGVRHVGPQSGLPVVTLKTSKSAGLKCPFVSDHGCTVYEDRPSSCRMYPLARMVRRNPRTGEMDEQFAVIKEPHCRGFEEGKHMTPAEWMEDQGLFPYNEINDLLMEVIAIKNRLRKKVLDPQEQRIFFLGAYDLDNFRKRLLACELHDADEILAEQKEAGDIYTDDVLLLKAGLKWIVRRIFPKGETLPDDTKR